MMKQLIKRPFSKIIAFAFLMLSSHSAYSVENDILHEIKNLREDMNRRFEQVDKRFEQVDRRFESVDKRFDQLMWFIGLWIPLSMGIVGYILQRLNKHDDRFFELSKKHIEAEDILVAIQHAKPEIKKRLKEALK